MTAAVVDIGALSITFANNFNATNTTLLGNGGTGNRNFTLGSVGGAPWAITNAATSGSVTFQSQNGSSGELMFTIGSSGTVNVAGGGAVVITALIQGSGSTGIVKAGAGLLTLGAFGNTYGGGTTVSAGTLLATANGALGSGDVFIGSAGTLNLASGVTNGIANSATSV